EGEIGKTLQRRLQDRISRARKIRLLHSICATGQRRIRHDRRIGTGPVAFAQLNKQSKSTDTEEISMGRGDQRSKRGKSSRGTSGKTRIKPKQKKRAKAAKRAAAKAA